jgi:diaminohydroxyphosphoribosylaminopyrimidine deaminase / 5-amino-6-(5-phosphoribosylamino)uracil reductase
MTEDEHYMRRALGLARLARAYTAPNPMVGAVIVRDGRIIGEGYHREFGAPHAEVNAVASVLDPDLMRDSTIYVTLEPCSHFGKTPPCADLLIEKGFVRVVVGMEDPNEKVAGNGIARLREAGIEVIVGVLEEECRELNKRFLTFHTKKRPYVVLKWAQSSDGFTDMERDHAEKGVNWITQPETQVFTHTLRSHEQAILAGWKTIQADDPSLTVRAVSGHDPVRIIVDPQLRSDLESIVYTDNRKTFVINNIKAGTHGLATYLLVDKITPASILESIWELGISSVLIEGGTTTIQQFADAQLWDEAVVITGKIIFGSGIPAPVFRGTMESTRTFGSDVVSFYLPIGNRS